jgi:allantoin racemase
MASLLVINPNTTEAVTAKVEALARRLISEVDVRSATGRFGAAYVADRTSFAIAGHAALDAFAAHGDGADAVLLACFGDPGLDALREAAGVPVIGLVEAAIAEAAAGGRRYGIVTGGRRWGPMLDEMIRMRRLEAGLAAIVTVAPTGGQIAADPEGAKAQLADACRDATSRGAEAVILGGAGLIGLAAPIAAVIGTPVICSVEAGIRAAAAALSARERRALDIEPVATTGLSEPLAALFAWRRA